jgi:16S rRNA (uracil1498-N3)-methyltransferase
MARRRFLVDQVEGNRAHLRGSQAHHLARVLRARPGQLVELSDRETVWLGRIDRVSSGEVEFELVERVAAAGSLSRLVLLAALIQFQRWEWFLEKGAELGVSEIIPLAAARCAKHLLGAAAKRAARWERILRQAAEQSRRTEPPLLEPLASPADAFPRVDTEVKILLSEKGDARLLREWLAERPSPPRAAALAVGPEGGWTEKELAAARAAGFQEASLGPTILRTETAVLAALAILSHFLVDRK